jgi:HEAT repeat protein
LIMARPLSFIALVGFAILFTFTGWSVARDDDEKDPVVAGKKASVWMDTLINEKSARQRALAVEALAKLWNDKRYEQALPTIGRALRLDSSAAVRTQAAIAIGSLRTDDLKLLSAAQQDAVKSLKKDLAESMGTEKESRVRKEIAKAIARYPEVPGAAVVQLTGALKDPDPSTRVAVAEALALAGSLAKSSASELAPLLADQDKSVRFAAVVALGRITPEGASAVAETMAKMLGTEKELDMKLELITSLGLLAEKSTVVVNALATLLTDSDESLRRSATRTLGTFGMGAAPAADALRKVAATDKAKDIRVEAVHAFGSAVGPEILKKRMKEFVPLLMDPEFEVRLAVVAEIGALGNDLKDDIETLKVLRSRLSDPHIKVREAVRAALERIEKKVEPKKDPEPKKEPTP